MNSDLQVLRPVDTGKWHPRLVAKFSRQEMRTMWMDEQEPEENSEGAKIRGKMEMYYRCVALRR